MNKFALAAVIAASLAAAAAPALAQPVNQREANQQSRINHGVATGALTPGEAARDQRHLGRIEAQADRERARNGGRLTPRQHARMEHRLNHESHRIYRTKHNGRVG